MARLLKFFIFSLSFALLFFLGQRSVYASPQEFIKAVQEGNNLQWYLGGKSGMLATTADSLLVAIVGARDENGNLISSGAVQAASAVIASTYQQPLSSTQYLAYVINHSGLTKSALAQGKGWEFLTKTTRGKVTSPQDFPVLLTLWASSRNAVYLLFIIVFVAIGFMIMFRSKLNPQTVVNIQMALPKIIVSLILVTFSYAICGFVVDTVFLGHRLIQAVFVAESDLDKYPLSGLIGKDYYSDVVEKIDFITALLLPNAPTGGYNSPWKGLDVFSSLGTFIGKDLWALLSNILTGDNFFTNLLPLIFAFTLLGVALKIFFALITKYVTIILSTVFSPFVFLINAFPANSGGVSNFLKTILSSALTFPAVSLMFFISALFATNDISINLTSLPPLNKTGVLDPSQTSLGTFERVLEPLIGLGILMATTQVPQAIDQALGVKPGITGAATPEVGSALRKIPIIGSLLG